MADEICRRLGRRKGGLDDGEEDKERYYCWKKADIDNSGHDECRERRNHVNNKFRKRESQSQIP